MDVHVRDETGELETVDAYLVWDDHDYYGPHLQGVCRTREDAVRFVMEGEDLAEIKGQARRLEEWYIEGVSFR